MSRSSFALLGISAFACGGATSVGNAFNTEWENDGGKSIAAVQSRLGSASPPAGTAIALGVTKSGISAALLDGSSKWKHRARLDGRPVVTGDVVVGSGDGKLFALDAKTGKPLWQISADRRAVRGAGDDGTTTVVSLGDPAGGGSRLLAVTRSGDVTRSYEPEVDLGVPGALDGVAFVPWGSQYVSAIDLSSGDEIGRLLMRDKVSHAVNIGGFLHFGEQVLVRFDGKIGQAATGGATRAELPAREFAGTPVWLGPGSIVNPVGSAAPDRIRLVARPSEDGFADERFVTTYFRVVMGLNSKDGALRWARTMPADIIAGGAAIGGFAMCDANGKVWLLDARAGADGGQVDIGEKLESCVVQTAAFAVKGTGDTEPLAEQVGHAIHLRMPQMVTAQRFLLRELGTLEDEVVTKVLVELASDPQTPPMLLEDARKLLASRRNGADYMIASLERPYDFLADVLLAPPVGPIADALAAIADPRGASLLAKHLSDPANTPDDVFRAARSLSTVATKAEFEDLKTFFALYRATAADDDIVNAVIAVAQAIVRVAGSDGAALVRGAAADPFTLPAVRTGIANLAPAPGKG